MQKRREKRAQLNKMIRRMKYIHVGQAWRAWVRKVAASKDKRPKIYRAAMLMLRTRAAKAFRSWVDFVHRRIEKRKIIARCDKPPFFRSLDAFTCRWGHGITRMLCSLGDPYCGVAVKASFRGAVPYPGGSDQ